MLKLATLLAVIISAASAQEQLKHVYKFATKRPFSYYRNHTLPFYELRGESGQVTHDVIRLTSLGISNQHAQLWSKQRYEVQPSGFEVEFSLSMVGNSMHGQGQLQLVLATGDTVMQDMRALSLKLSGGTVSQLPVIVVLLNGQEQIGACQQPYRNTLHPFRVKMSYRPTENDGALSVQVKLEDSWILCSAIGKLNSRFDYQRGVYIGVDARNDAVGGDIHDVHSIDLHEYVTALLSGKKAHAVTEHEQEVYQQMHDRVEKVRTEHDQLLEQPLSNESPSMQRINDVQMRMLMKLDDIETRLMSGGGVPSGGSGGGGSLDQLHASVAELKKQNSQILELLSDLAQYLTRDVDIRSTGGGASSEHVAKIDAIIAQVDSLHTFVAQSSAKIDQVGQRQAISGGGQIQSQNFWQESGFWYGVSVFFVAQVALVIMYGRWQRGAEQHQKKFI